MRRFLLCLLLSFAAVYSFAQSEGARLYDEVIVTYEEFFKNYSSHDRIKVKEGLINAAEALHAEGLDSLAASAFCYAGELEVYDAKRSKQLFESAQSAAHGCNTDIELLSTVSIALYDVSKGNPRKAWDAVKDICEGISGMHRLRYKVTAYQLIALIAVYANEYSEAIKIYETIRSIDTGNDSIAHLRQIDALGDYSTCLLVLGQYDEALIIVDDAIDLLIDYADTNGYPLLLGRMMTSFGSTLSRINGSYKDAVTCFELALEFCSDLYNEDYSELIHIRKQLAIAYSNLNEHDKAYKELDLAIAQARRIYGDTHHELMIAYTLYATALLGEMRFPDAREKAREAVRIANAIDAFEIDPHLILLMADWLMNDEASAQQDALVFLGKSKEYFHNSFIVLPERERESFWLNNGTVIMTGLVNAAVLKDGEGILYDAALMSKGVLMNTSRHFAACIESDASGRLVELRDKCKDLYYRALYMAKGDEASRLEAEKLRQEANSLEYELMRELKARGTELKAIDCSWRDVAAALDKKEAAVEFLRYNDMFRKISYIASVIMPGGTPVNVPLPALSDAFLAEQAAGKAYSDASLYEAALAPLMPYLAGCKRVWFSPSGALSSIALENIRTPDGGTAEDLFEMRRLSSTRELAIPAPGGKWTTAALFGGINYNLSEEGKEYYAETTGLRSSSGATYWKALPGSMDEVRRISAMLSGTETMVVTADAAVEESFKALSGKGYNLIHVATHGYYPENVTLMVGDDRLGKEDTAMQTCGLVFAGANSRSSEGGNVGDGLLSAQEISAIDLTGCDLVVLSACGTGLGIINFDESYGLMRAFKKAGCASILMTLWDIDDASTGLFMQEFYSARLRSGDNAQALSAAKAAVKSHYPDPRYWAGFVLID